MEYEEMREKYGDVKIKLVSYYKYTFKYIGNTADGKLTVYVGGDHNDIYRFEVKADEEITIASLNDMVSSIYLNEEKIYDEWF